MEAQAAPKKHTNPDDTATPTITCFVYGTLRRGHANHARFCRNAIDIRPATTWGRLYRLPAGYPALEVPESAILAHGTADPRADAATQARLATTLPPQAADCPPAGDWDLIHGELITFPDPARDLPPLDRLEGFRPGQASLYHRVLAQARVRGKAVAVWVYIVGEGLCSIRARSITSWPR